jgi:hypothetical protein
MPSDHACVPTRASSSSGLFSTASSRRHIRVQA